MEMLNVALPKGRLGEKVYDMFEKAGYSCPSIKENTRKLIFVNEELKLPLLLPIESMEGISE
mgnify:CR=1 FL=1